MALQSGNKFTERAAFKRLGKGVSTGVNRITGGSFLTELFSGIFYFFVGLGAFSVRSVLRRKLGERSFGLLTILLTFIWLRLLYAWKYLEFAPCEMLFGVECGVLGHGLYYLLIPISLIVNLFVPGALELVKTNEGFGNAFNPFNFGLGDSLAGFYSVVFLIFAFIALGESIYRIFKKVRWYSYYRGKSSLFDWWLTGKKIGSFVISERIIWMILEPLTVALISGFSYLMGDILLSKILMIGAVCLFIEEYGDYREERGVILDVIDGEIVNERIITVKAEYNIDEEQHYKNTDEKETPNSELTI